MSSKHSDRTTQYESPITALRDSLEHLPTVDTVEVNEARVPSRLLVSLSTADVEPAIEDAISMFDAELHNPRVADDESLSFELIVKDKFKDSGMNSLRKRGGSSMIAIPPEALSESGFETGDNLHVESRDSEIRITKNKTTNQRI